MAEEEIKEITNYIFLDSEPEKADLILVFGTQHEEPILKVKELYDRGFASRILISGGVNRTTKENEALRIKKSLLALGIDNKDIILEDKSTNTLENVVFSLQVIEDTIGLKNVKKIIIIVKCYHARRALMTLKKHFPKSIKIIPVAYKIFGLDKNNWYLKEKGIEKVTGEWQKISKYLAKGDIEEL